MTLRVIGGEHRGRLLKTVRGLGTRPLLGQVREALFNILQGRFEGAEVWDLFAGTGASGIEALSRGAARVLFVEKSNPALAVLRQNLAQFGPELQARSHVIRSDAWDPPSLRPEGELDEAGDPAERPPDVVFFDPPYAAVAEDPVRAATLARRLVARLAPAGVLCFHFRAGTLDAQDFEPDLQCDLRTWGSSAIAFLQRRDDGQRRQSTAADASSRP
jgi:16S rRNA (guanine966-N2)-methyltransferase